MNSERFFRLQEKWMYTSRYTQSQAVDRARVSLYLWVIFVISLLFPRFETQRKQRFKQVFVIILQKKTKRHFSSHQNTNSITHTYSTRNVNLYISILFYRACILSYCAIILSYRACILSGFPFILS